MKRRDQTMNTTELFHKNAENTISLFKAVVIDETSHQNNNFKEIARDLITSGIYLDPTLAHLTDEQLTLVTAITNKLFTITSTQKNSTLLSSWDDITEYLSSDRADSQYAYHNPLSLHQHESDKKETLNQYVTITGVSVKELKEKVETLTSANMALSEQTIKSLIQLINDYDLNVTLDSINNKELQAMLVSELDLIPSDLAMFLRCAIYNETGYTLLIKDQRTLEALATRNTKTIKMFYRFYTTTDTTIIAKDFYRYKSYLMALKHMDASFKNPINRIRKAAAVYHVPLPVDPLMNAIATIDTMTNEEFKHKVKNRDTKQMIKALNALRLFAARQGKQLVTVYRIRNGRSFAKELNQRPFNANQMANLYERIDILNTLIVDRIRDKYKDQQTIVVLDNSLTIPAPTSLKSAVGSLPLYTSTRIDNNTVFGITWDFDADIDLSATSPDHYVSWNSQWQGNLPGNNEAIIQYSGDMTHLNDSGTATELIRCSKAYDQMIIIANTLYSSRVKDDTKELTYKLFVADNSKSIDRHNIKKSSDPTNHLDNVKLLSRIPLNDSTTNLGLILPTTDGQHIAVLTNEKLSMRTVANANAQRDILEDIALKARTVVTVNELLSKAGIIVTNKRPEPIDGVTIIDLSLNTIDMSKLIELIN